jgi:hypothetical protein
LAAAAPHHCRKQRASLRCCQARRGWPRQGAAAATAAAAAAAAARFLILILFELGPFFGKLALGGFELISVAARLCSQIV